MTDNKNNYDVIVFGATSFVGKIICHYLAKQYGEKGPKWAMAGRSQAKLNVLQNELQTEHNTDITTLVADAGDAEALAQLCERATVILSTVGPYSLYGEPMVKACVESGTDYVDLTGEPQWIKAMQDGYETQAQQTGARIVHSCGFDSIPSDLGVYYLQNNAIEQFGKTCQTVNMRVRRLKGGASGGTIASMLNIVEEAKKDPGLRKQLANPYVLCPAGHSFKAYQPNLKKAKYEPEFEAWVAPFVMAAINTRIVHRSNALLGAKYGERFIYDEAMQMGRGSSGMMRGWSMTLGLSAFMIGASIAPIKHWMENKMLPKPGEGPTPEEQENGMYDIRFYGETCDEEKIVVKALGDKDPGYGSTAKIIAEAALCLASNENVRQNSGGFYTPASCFKDQLYTPLAEKAGLTFEVLD